MEEKSVSEWLTVAREKYLEARKYLSESKNDPPTEPYKSKYKAAEILRNLESDLNEDKYSDETSALCYSLISALVNYELGVIALETDELSNSNDYLQKSWEILKEFPQKPEACLLAVSTLNQLGILWSSRNEPKKACEYLKQAEIIYGEYKISKQACPLSFTDLFSIPDKNAVKNTDWSIIEKVLTHTLYYLAQVYEHLGDNELSARYCHITLKRQLDSGDYDPLDWSINCATLSQYFIAKDNFIVARHVLACSDYIMLEYEEKLKQEVENKEEDKWEMFNRGKADIARCWAKYCIFLLIASRDKISEKKLEVETKDNKEKELEVLDKVYRLLKESKIKDVENKITCELALDFEKARPIFLFAQDCLKQAKVFYALNDHTYDYVQILQDSSKLYKLLATFEKDFDRQCKMHKRRIDMLEEVLRKLNPQYYLALCRQLMFELAETYNEMMDIKLYAVNAEKRELSPHVIKKINMLANKSIEHFTSFINTLRDSKDELPETFADDVVRPALVAYFYLGRLYSKIKTAEPTKEMEYLKKSEECYKFLIKYVERNPQHEKELKAELPVIKEVLELIPGKMQTIVGTTMY